MAGLYFEDFEEGAIHKHQLSRTVTEMDNMLFSNMTLNPQPLHIDRHFCERHTEWGQPIVNSLFTLGLLIGITVNDLTIGTTVANLGMKETKFPHPVFHGDTIYATTKVLSKRESRSRPDVGLVELEHT
ncbi:MAG: MaoC family dehydratase, partial [Pseudomonadota bacterium]